MKAVVIREQGAPGVLRIEERPVPTPRADEALVRVRAVGLNHLDLWVRQGIPGHRFPLPIIPGCDFAGDVAAVGEVTRNVAVGERVVVNPGFACQNCAQCRAGRHQLCRSYGIFGEHRDGGCAEYAVVPHHNCMPMPAGMSYVEAAAVPLVFLTAWAMLVDRAHAEVGENVLVHAAGSGVSSAGIQIARLLGCRVLATAGDDDKCEKARALGADVAINYRKEDFAAVVRDQTGGKGADVIFDHVGGDTWKGNMKAVRWGGRIVMCGATTSPVVEVDLRQVFFKSISILGSTMGSMGLLDRILHLMRAGKLRPVVGAEIPLERIVEAHQLLESRQVFGKVVVTVGG
ncbi:MAG: zinc-binding dehydrogenase [Planctomycetes bacterium]|nr:zinc-binding dehydrogenase [Planctomycetota bacterium]